MDGWETRRKRVAGHDWCIIQLGLPGSVEGLHIDTAFFTGNQAPKISVQAMEIYGPFLSNLEFCFSRDMIFLNFYGL